MADDSAGERARVALGYADPDAVSGFLAGDRGELTLHGAERIDEEVEGGYATTLDAGDDRACLLVPLAPDRVDEVEEAVRGILANYREHGRIAGEANGEGLGGGYGEPTGRGAPQGGFGDTTRGGRTGEGMG